MNERIGRKIDQKRIVKGDRKGRVGKRRRGKEDGNKEMREEWEIDQMIGNGREE